MVTFANQADFISFRHHMYDKPRGAKSITLKAVRARPPACVRAAEPVLTFGCACRRACLQVGPRFEMRLYQVKLGTMEQQEAEVEWALRPYMRSGKKRKL